MNSRDLPEARMLQNQERFARFLLLILISHMPQNVVASGTPKNRAVHVRAILMDGLSGSRVHIHGPVGLLQSICPEELLQCLTN